MIDKNPSSMHREYNKFYAVNVFLRSIHISLLLSRQEIPLWNWIKHSFCAWRGYFSSKRRAFFTMAQILLWIGPQDSSQSNVGKARRYIAMLSLNHGVLQLGWGTQCLSRTGGAYYLGGLLLWYSTEDQSAAEKVETTFDVSRFSDIRLGYDFVPSHIQKKRPETTRNDPH